MIGDNYSPQVGPWTPPPGYGQMGTIVPLSDYYRLPELIVRLDALVEVLATLAESNAKLTDALTIGVKPWNTRTTRGQGSDGHS